MENTITDFVAFDKEGSKVRATADKRFSVYDVLVAFGVTDKANCRNVFSRITSKYPEVLTKCINFKFPGRGQRQTPVATEEGMYQILMLCPGKRGAEFRAWVADIIANPDKAIAYGINRYAAMGKDDAWIQVRFEQVLNRKFFTDTLKDHGVHTWGYAKCTDAINVGVLGKTAADIKAERKVKSVRDSNDMAENAALLLAEKKAAVTIEYVDAQGNNQCAAICGDVAGQFGALLEETKRMEAEIKARKLPPA